MSQVSNDLEAAMAILESRGWCQHAPDSFRAESGENEVCAEAAVAMATLGNKYAWGVRNPRDGELLIGVCIDAEFNTGYRSAEEVGRHLAALDALKVAMPRGGDVWMFNDDPSTSVEDIKLMFKRAIEENR